MLNILNITFVKHKVGKLNSEALVSGAAGFLGPSWSNMTVLDLTGGN